MGYDLILFETPDRLAAEVASRLSRRVLDAAARGTRFHLALSGGRISNDLFRGVAAVAADPVVLQAWQSVDWFWADERCVPPDHVDSNYRSASELLLAPLRIAPERVHRIEGELDPADAARRASAVIRAVAGVNPPTLPVMDLILLGMGEDGHIASLFPGAGASVVACTEPFLNVVGPKPPPHRVTMSYPQLIAGTEVWVLVSGAGQEIALRNSILGGGITPLGALLEIKNCTIFSSVAVAESLKSGFRH
jgi:6-phosphogluconolactonase